VPRGYTSRHTLQAAAVGTGVGTPMDVSGFRWVGVQVVGITSATITWQVSIDGTNWVGILAAPPSTGTGALTTTADGVFRVDVAGFAQFRANITTWVSGAITVTALASTGD
jgi:hypothetical protein